MANEQPGDDYDDDFIPVEDSRHEGVVARTEVPSGRTIKNQGKSMARPVAISGGRVP